MFKVLDLKSVLLQKPSPGSCQRLQTAFFFQPNWIKHHICSCAVFLKPVYSYGPWFYDMFLLFLRLPADLFHAWNQMTDGATAGFRFPSLTSAYILFYTSLYFLSLSTKYHKYTFKIGLTKKIKPEKKLQRTFSVKINNEVLTVTLLFSQFLNIFNIFKLYLFQFYFILFYLFLTWFIFI